MNEGLKLRVLIFHPALTPYRVDLFNAIAQRVQLDVVFLQENAFSQKFDTQELVSRCRFRHQWHIMGKSIGRFYFRDGLKQLIDKIKPDVVVTHEFLGVTLQIMYVLMFHRPISHVIWTSENSHVVKGHGWARNFIKSVMMKRVAGLIVYTDEVLELYRKELGYSAEAAIVPNIPGSTEFRSWLAGSDSNARELVSRYQWQSTKIVLFVGRLAPEKRVDRLIRAFALLHVQGEKQVLVIVGDGTERASLEDLADSMGVRSSVHFLGRLEGNELAAVYRLGAVFVLPSTYEPFGAVVNEALLAGMPVVCTNVVGARVMIERGKNGSTVDGDDEEAMRREIRFWLSQGGGAEKRLEALMPSMLPVELGAVVDGLEGMFKVIHGG